MTYIEFFDKDVCENICSCLVISPERVILIGDNKKLLEKHAYRYGEVLRSKGFDIEFLYRSVNKNQIQSIIAVLTDIIEEYDNCVFDLTGGDELYLTSVGVLFERFKDTNLKRIRTVYGCTQAELSERSGVSLRSIQMYEQRNKDINKASAEALYRISKVLGCTIEDLLEK